MGRIGRATRRPAILALTVALLCGGWQRPCGAEEPPAPADSPEPQAPFRDLEDGPVRKEFAYHWRAELKREATERGTPEETTKTTVRLEAYLKGPFAYVRLDVPLPDEKTDFEGSVFDPHVGDLKVRLQLRPVPIAGLPIVPWVETTFPTADPDTLGSGKVQLAGGLRYNVLLFQAAAASRPRRLLSSFQVSQNVSVAGDVERKDINNTRFALSLTCLWARKPSLKLSFKPTIDWVQDAKTGAVLELEFRWQATPALATWLKPGTLLWGEGVPGTYKERVGLGCSYRF